MMTLVSKDQGADQEQETLYNPVLKNAFLAQYPQMTSATYSRIFTHSYSFEEHLGKDMYEWNAIEIKDFLQSLKPLTLGASKTNGSIVSSYMQWAIQRKLREHLRNPLQSVDEAWYEQFVDKNQKIYITETELRRIEDFCINAQDAVIFRLLFEGAEGKGCVELCNLRKKDVSPDGVLTLRDDDSVRQLSVSLRAMKQIEAAMKQKIYFKSNQMMDAPDNVRSYTDLVDSEFVIRNSITRTERLEAVDKHTIYRRIDKIKGMFGGFDSDYLSAKNIRKSGMIKYARELAPSGSLKKEHYLEIARRFNVKNWWRIQETVNEITLQEVYGK